jgi:CHAD domain-containing protein
MAEGKWIDGLEAEMPVAEAARIVLAVRFGVVCTHVPAAVDSPYEDREHVHQLRVGARRATAALKAFDDYLSKKEIKAANKALRAIRQAAGDARDWDVFIESLETTRSLKDSGGKPALDFLLGYALGERSAAQKRLEKAAEKTRDKLEALAAELPEQVRESGKHSEETFGKLAEADLADRFQEFAAAVAERPTDPDELHELRILGKHLRYAIEIFAGCFGPPLKEKLYPAIEAMQEFLGELQDARVGIERMEALRSMARQALGAEWARLRPGLTKVIAGLRAKVRSGKKRFTTWANEWEKLVEEYSLEVLERS